MSATATVLSAGNDSPRLQGCLLEQEPMAETVRMQAQADHPAKLCSRLGQVSLPLVIPLLGLGETLRQPCTAPGKPLGSPPSQTAQGARVAANY